VNPKNLWKMIFRCRLNERWIYINYKGFEIRITDAKVPRRDRQGRTLECDGFIVEIFTQDIDIPVNVFNAAVGYELLENSIDEAEQLVKDYIDVEEKELRRTDNFID